MKKLLIRGGNVLKGEVTIGGAKNAAVALLPGAMFATSPCIIENVPAIADIQALKTYDPLYSLELAEHIQSLFDEHMPFVPLCFDTTTVYLRGNFASGVECSTQDIFYNIERWQNPK